MSRYIDAEWVRDLYADFEQYEGRDDWTTPIANVLAVIEDAPSLDLVTCAECKWYDGTAMSNVRCRCVDKGKHMKGLVENYADDFCSYGQRKESE